MKVGFIGLGIMGQPMALNLGRGGHELFLHSRSGVPEERLQRHRARCARWCCGRRCRTGTNRDAADRRRNAGRRGLAARESPRRAGRTQRTRC